ncbi:MAG: hypothetical protein WC445_03435 [Patescibacteria group bacterium]
MKKIELLKYFLLFIVAFSLFSYFQISPTFPDPDSFYHAKMAVLTRDQGIVRDFPWLQFTVLKNNFADHHFLYHVALIPFVTFLDPLVGIKLFTALSAALLILVFYWFLKKFQIKGAFLYSLVLLVSSPLVFRINLAKAASFSLIILLLGLYFIFRRKLWPLFLLSFIYVWTYGGWPLILVLTLFYIFAEAVINATDNFTGIKLFIKNFFKNIFSKENVKLFLACFGGLAAGIVINPFFPKNLFFYWQQIIKIAVINYQDKIGVGAEWYPYGLGDLIANSSFVFILLILSFTVIFINFLKKFSTKERLAAQDPKTKTQIFSLTLLALFFLALTLRSRRNVEYFIPFAALASAFVLNEPLSLIKKYLPAINVWRQKRKIFFSLILVYVLIMIPFTSVRNIWSIKQLYLSGGSIYKYRGVAEWLKNNTSERAIIFHNDWDDFPALFYYNTHNYYIAGLDPTFMYDYNKDLHKVWVDITTGRRANISEIVKNDFHSEYVFVDKDHIALENNLKSDGHFQMVYKDDEGKIYKLIND